jgi:hypothetical protein
MIIPEDLARMPLITPTRTYICDARCNIDQQAVVLRSDTWYLHLRTMVKWGCYSGIVK